MLIAILVSLFLLNNISCDESHFLFPSYDDIIENVTEVVCPELPKVNNADVVIKKLGARRKVATITCDHSYDIVGNSNIYCVDGQWEYFSPPQCIRRCLSPPYLKNGALEIEGIKDEEGYFPRGTVAAYSCSQGYELTPETSNLRVCEKGQWTGPVATCIPKIIQITECPAPKPIENGNFVLENTGDLEGYSSGQRLHYSCKMGYSLTGPRVQQCLDDGTWSPKRQPMCNVRVGE